jgi:hypothetical protein
MGKELDIFSLKFEDGQTYFGVTGKTLNAFVRAIRECRPLGGLGTSIEQTADGTRINAKGGSGSGTGGHLDFWLYDASDETDFRIGVKFGNVTPLIDSEVNPWPDVFSAESDPPWDYSFIVTETGMCWLEVDIDLTSDPLVTAITVNNGTTFPTADGTHAYLMLGNWAIVAGVLTIANTEGIGSQIFDACRRWFNPTVAWKYTFKPA